MISEGRKSIHKSLIIRVLFLLVLFAFSSVKTMASGGENEEFNPGHMIMHHVTDAHEWHLFDIGETAVTIPPSRDSLFQHERIGYFHVQ